MLNKQQQAPAFSLPDQDNVTVNLADYRGKQNVVLYFYPRDDTPGCTIEANQFTALAGAFAEQDTVVIGVSRDPVASHRDFVNKYGLKLRLLADTGGAVCEAYGVWQEMERNGKKKPGIVRSTFLINKDGVLEEALYDVAAEGHAQAMLERVKEL